MREGAVETATFGVLLARDRALDSPLTLAFWLLRWFLLYKRAGLQYFGHPTPLADQFELVHVEASGGGAYPRGAS